MAGSLNRAFLIGHVGADPEIKTGAEDKRFAKFSIATGESWTDRRTGERKGHTDWHYIVVYNERIAEIVEKYVRRGSKVCIEGVVRTREWHTPSGEKRFATEVIVERYVGSLTLLGEPKTGEEP